MKFFEAIANVFRIPDLRKRVLFTLGLLAVYRLGGHVPIPGLNTERWAEIFSQTPAGSSAFSTCSPAAISAAHVFALGIMPYITRRSFCNLLTVVVPTLEKLSKEGELGAAKSPSGPATSP
jgi:preprotein translocase subunit SecY